MKKICSKIGLFHKIFDDSHTKNVVVTIKCQKFSSTIECFQLYLKLQKNYF